MLQSRRLSVDRRSLPDSVRFALLLSLAFHVLVIVTRTLPPADLQSFYGAGLAWRGLPNPFDAIAPNLNPPFLTPFFAAFTMMPFQTAFVVWTALSLACCASLVRPIARVSGYGYTDVALMLVGTVPAGLVWVYGQTTFFLLFSFTHAWLDARAHRDLRSGIWLGIVCVVKPLYGLLLLWALWQRRWQLLAGSAYVGVAAAMVVALVTPKEIKPYLHVMSQIDWYHSLNNCSIFGYTERIFAARYADAHALSYGMCFWTPLTVSPVLARLCWLGGSGFVLWRSATSLRRNPHADCAFSILALAGALVGPLAWVNYLQIGLAPLISIARRSSAIAAACAVSFFPYWMVWGDHFSPLGTAIVGLWAPATAGLWWWVTVRSVEAETGASVDD